MFNKTEKQQQQEISTALTERLKTFLDKLSEKARELYDGVRDSAQSLADQDSDPFKRSYLQFKSGILGQFTVILQKGSNTFQEQVMPKAGMAESIKLSALFNNWHSRVLNMMVTAFDGITERDLEKEYAEAMDVYNDLKNKFQCRQCGSPLIIERFYFLATYISCPHCRTQNTFDPGTKVKMIEHLARPLAELRCDSLKKRYEQLREEKGAAAAFECYDQYTQALINEMNKILPGLEAQHQNFYDRMISDYRQFDILRN